METGDWPVADGVRLAAVTWIWNCRMVTPLGGLSWMLRFTEALDTGGGVGFCMDGEELVHPAQMHASPTARLTEAKRRRIHPPPAEFRPFW